MAFHSKEVGVSIHSVYVWTYANAAARTGAAGFVIEDIGKIARQLDDDTLWMLIAAAPTWVQVGKAAAPAVHAPNHSDGGSDEITVENLATAGTDGQVPTSDGAGGLVMEDPAEVVGGAHSVIRQLIHFIDNGPAEGFASGAYRETTGTVFPTAVIWYTDNGKTDKIVEKNTTWGSNKPTTIEWKMYDTDGSTVLATISDAISYTGVFETNRTRTITVS